MALTYPRDMTSGLCWEEHEFTLRRRQEMSGTAGGETQTKDLGPPLWVARFDSYPMPVSEADALEAAFQDLGGGAQTFFAVPRKRRPGPAGVLPSDAFAGVLISEIRIDFRAFKLQGLPADAEILAGDYLSVDTPVGGVELFRASATVQATGSGDTDWIDLVLPIRPAVTIGATVRLVEPRCEMRLEPDGLQVVRHSLRRRRVTLRAEQVIR